MIFLNDMLCSRVHDLKSIIEQRETLIWEYDTGEDSNTGHQFAGTLFLLSVPKAGMEFKGQGRLSYDPSGRPQRVLVVSVRFLPTSPLGVLVHRVDQPCPQRGCDVSVTLSLDAAHPVLEVTGMKTKVKVKSSQAVEVSLFCHRSCLF